MAINKENIQKTIDLMKFDESLRFDMNDYVTREEGILFEDETPEWCGTVCCLAGYASVAALGSADEAYNKSGDAFDIGRDYLGITDEQADALFTPEDRAAFKASKQDGIAMLEHLRDTGEVDWEFVGYENHNVRDDNDWWD